MIDILKSMLYQQEILDTRIHASIGLTMEETEEKRIMALSTELAELVNEMRFFKYWSKKEPDRERILEEAADVLHFIFSLSNSNNIKLVMERACHKSVAPLSMEAIYLSMQYSLYQLMMNHNDIKELQKRFHMTIDRREQYAEMVRQNNVKNLNTILGLLLMMCEKYDITLEKLYAEYVKKNGVNHERQTNGY